MKSVILLVGCLMAASLALAEGQKLSCSFTVTPRRGDSSVTKSNSGRILSQSSSQLGTGSKTITRNLKWQVDLRFRDRRPGKLELKAYYIGQGGSDNKLKLIGQDSKKIELDDDGKASVELTSPTTRLTKTRTRSTTSSRYSGGFTSIKKRQTGERVMGCVVQLFADGEMLKSYTSDSRWTSAAGKVPFSLAELAARSGKIGLR